VAWLILLCFGISIGLAAFAMTLGTQRIPIEDVLASVLGLDQGQNDLTVRQIRLPRVTIAILAGASLAGSGAIYQALIRNPLVSPDIIGVTQGATVGALLLITGVFMTGGGIIGSVVSVPSAIVPIGAFLGAIAAAFLNYALAWRRGVSGTRLVLIGIGLNAMLAAVSLYLLVTAKWLPNFGEAYRWQVGSLYSTKWEDVLVLALAMAVLLPAALALSARLQVFQLGEEVALGAGLSLERNRAMLLFVATALAAIAVAVTGPISFLALIVPHAARFLAGPFSGGVLLLSAALGSILLIVSDVIAQNAFKPLTVPAGVVTAALGAPYLLFLLYRYNRRS
jgi:iron complex transport system permease protein